MNKKKLFKKILSASPNIPFREVKMCVEAFGFTLDRVSGSHHIYVHPDIPELLNLQNSNGKAKPYQIKQFLKLIERHSLRLEE